MIEQLSDYPEDYQQILVDLVATAYPDLDLDSFTVVMVGECLIEDHMGEFHEMTDHWSHLDWELVDDYADGILSGSEPPPLIICSQKGLLRDGYHRHAAFQKIGRVSCRAIYLDNCLV